MERAKTSRLMIFCVAAVCLFALGTMTRAELLVLPATNHVFSGPAQRLSVRFQNSGESTVTTEVKIKIFQAGSGVGALAGQTHWKSLSILPGQIVLESAELDFPQVRAVTRFVIQWLDGTNGILGRTSAFVYPANLLKQLGPELGVFDPDSVIKPALLKSSLAFADLDDEELEHFDGKLAIVATLQEQASEKMSAIVRKVAARGTAVVWIKPEPEHDSELPRPYHVLSEGKGAVVVAQPSVVGDLVLNPKSQKDLLALAQLALNS